MTKRYGRASAVVDDVSLRIEHGRLGRLLGPSGCGKTTTLRLIAGFVEPTDGEIRVGDGLVRSQRFSCCRNAAICRDDLSELRAVPHLTVGRKYHPMGLKLRKDDRETINRKLEAITANTRLARGLSRLAIRANSRAASSSASRWRAR